MFSERLCSSASEFSLCTKETAVGWRLENVENPCTEHCSFQSHHFVVKGPPVEPYNFWFESCWNHYRVNMQAEHAERLCGDCKRTDIS